MNKAPLSSRFYLYVFPFIILLIPDRNYIEYIDHNNSELHSAL